MTRPFVIGVTGGIGSGKSAVTARFSEQGVPVFDADIVARELVEPGEPALAEIVGTFGQQMLDASDRLDRAALRAVVFNDDAARARLNAILHPRVHDRLHALATAPGPALVLVAIPLLAESAHRYHWLDRVLVVDVPREVQIQRAMWRDALDRAAAERMLAAQADRASRLALADDALTNDGPIERLDDIVARLHARYVALAITIRP
ncbi:dephospho-CoA kinase [Xanthomonadaceae bacterium XH05]|nr:dephospho-CoA kinase [Xanthomonadaceae bacterium XH05]